MIELGKRTLKLTLQNTFKASLWTLVGGISLSLSAAPNNIPDDLYGQVKLALENGNFEGAMQAFDDFTMEVNPETREASYMDLNTSYDTDSMIDGALTRSYFWDLSQKSNIFHASMLGADPTEALVNFLFVKLNGKLTHKEIREILAQMKQEGDLSIEEILAAFEGQGEGVGGEDSSPELASSQIQSFLSKFASHAGGKLASFDMNSLHGDLAALSRGESVDGFDLYNNDSLGLGTDLKVPGQDQLLGLGAIAGFDDWDSSDPVSYTHLTLPTNREV